MRRVLVTGGTGFVGRAAYASMFRCLPPLPHTLALMANAYRVGRSAAR